MDVSCAGPEPSLDDEILRGQSRRPPYQDFAQKALMVRYWQEEGQGWEEGKGKWPGSWAWRTACAG